MKKIFRLLLCYVLFFSSFAVLHAASSEEGEKSALTLRANALQKENVRESLKYLTSHIHLAKNDSEKRSILYYTASLQETLGQFVAAAATYASAAAIDADDAQGMPAASNAELYLYAARSSLEACDFQSADSYLDASPINSSTDLALIARKRLLSAWSALCKAGDYEEARGVVANLEGFVQNDQLVDIRCEVLFTLWYVTEDEKWKELLKKDYPRSPEAAIADGKGVVMAMPFWYFMPRASLSASEGMVTSNKEGMESREQDTSVVSDEQSAIVQKNGQKKNASGGSEGTESSSSGTVQGNKTGLVREQIGFFRKEENAQKLVERAVKSGFSAYYYSERRPSGADYFVVVVDEDESGSMGKKLRNAGFDCYPIKD